MVALSTRSRPRSRSRRGKTLSSRYQEEGEAVIERKEEEEGGGPFYCPMLLLALLLVSAGIWTAVIPAIR